MERMENFERNLRFVTSLIMLTLDKILVGIVVPLITQWEWALATDSYVGESEGDAEIQNTSLLSAAVNDTSAAPRHQMKASPKLTVIFLAYSSLEFILTPISGYLGDKYGLDCVAIAGVLLAGTISILYAFLSSLPGILIARLLQGASTAFLSPTAFARLAEAFSDDADATRRVMTCAMATSMFSFLGPGLAGITFQYFGPVPCFMSILAISVVVFIGIAITFRFNGNISANNLSQDHLDSTESLDLKPPVTLLDVLKDHQIQAAVILFTAAWLPRTFLEPTLSIWISNTFNGGGPALSGAIWGTAGLSVVASSVITSFVAIRKPDHIWLFGLVNIFAAGLPLVLLSQSTHPAMAAVCFSTCIYLSFCARNTLICMYKSITDSKFRGSYALVMGIFHFGFTLPYIIGAPVAIPLFNTVGFELMCIVVAGLVWASCPLFLCFRTSSNTNEEDEQDRLIQDNGVSSMK